MLFMFDTVLFDKICSVNCSDQELKEFKRGIERRKFDTDNAFDKYYSIESILKCFDLYKTGKISEKFLADWAYAYDFIIMGGFKRMENEDSKMDTTLKKVISWEISDWLDSLSFAYMYDTLEIDDYSNGLCTMDAIYKNIDDWNAFYSYTGMKYDNGEDFSNIYVLLVNDKSREFIIFENDGCDFREYKLQANLCEEAALEQMMRDLKNMGYKELLPSIED
jgi:hypothetical protein